METTMRDRLSAMRSVTAAVVAGFGLCLVALGALMASAITSAYRHERQVAEEALVAAAESEAEYANVGNELLPYVAELAAQPGLALLDASACEGSLSVFTNVVGDGFAVALIASDGSTLCTIPGDAELTVPPDVLDAALAGEAIVGDAFVEPVSRRPVVPVSTAVEGTTGNGALVALTYLDALPLEIPAAVDHHTVLVALDSARELVLTTSEGAPYHAGSRLEGSHLTQGLGESSRIATDPDGTERIWREVLTDDGWVVAAGLDVDVAFLAADAQRRELLAVGAGVLTVVISLAVALQRRLARPISRLGAAIRSSRSGDRSARAPEIGPTEVVEVAVAFNALVDAQHALEDRLRFSATHDALTGLPNRAALTDALERALGDADATPLAVLFIDLDHFKLVNDSHGHAVGDELLVALAERLRMAAGDGCLVSRFGGDEFVLLCRGCEDPVPEAERLADVLRSTLRVGGHELGVGGSIGIAIARPGDAADDLLREADTAMYRAKETGRGGYAVFDDEMRAWTMARLTTERDLRGALERGELLLHYQPIVSLATGEVVGAEALVRWQHPVRGLVGPIEFIGVAEETDLISPLGAWVLETAARQAATWRRETGRRLPVAVNVAARQLAGGGLLPVLTEALARAGAEPSDVTLEVTESAVLTDVDNAVAQLEAARRLGVRVAIDDFGTGYSSLSYLQRLPVDVLKIDRSFVSRVGVDSVSTAIVSSVVDLAHAVGLRVVAEGVEEAEQLTTLGRLGCDLAQGFHLAMPAPAAEVDLGATLPVTV
jgi:diguanylate cyclase (GGDEF)-like protein